MYIPPTLFHMVPDRGYTVNSYPNQVTVFIGLICLANVHGQVSPLAFGMTPAREAERAGGMTKVPKAWGLAAPAR